MPQDITTKQEDNGKLEKLSIQQRTEDENQIASIPSLFWFTRKDDGSEISAWWSPQRDFELREFWRRTGNDILQGAIASMVKKFVALNYIVEGPQRVVNRFSPIMANAEFGQGWGRFLTKLLTDYLTQDKGSFWENIGAGNPNGPISGPVLGIAHLDSQFCQLTGDPTFPVIFHNAKDNQSHKLHASRVVHIVDMASPNELFNNVGFCAVSRTIASSQVLLKLAQYKNEKLDDLPEAGILAINNVVPKQFEDMKANYARGRRNLAQEIWAPVMTIFGFDPTQPVSIELVSFANLPDAFDEQESTDIYAKIVALAFGVDVREFWPLSAGSLGTATESEVQAQKAKGKGVGELIGTIERAINWKVLPASVEFKFDFQDDDEDKLRAEIDEIKTGTIMSMDKPDGPVTSLEIRQMLADNVDYFSEDFLLEDITDETTLTDTEQDTDKMFGPRVTVDKKGNVKLVRGRKFGRRMTDAMLATYKNYKEGKITSEQIAEFAIAEMIDDKADSFDGW